jgi:hypothetical protein
MTISDVWTLEHKHVIAPRTHIHLAARSHSYKGHNSASAASGLEGVNTLEEAAWTLAR